MFNHVLSIGFYSLLLNNGRKYKWQSEPCFRRNQLPVFDSVYIFQGYIKGSTHSWRGATESLIIARLHRSSNPGECNVKITPQSRNPYCFRFGECELAPSARQRTRKLQQRNADNMISIREDEFAYGGDRTKQEGR